MTELSDVDARGGQQHQRKPCASDVQQPRRRKMREPGVRQQRIAIAATSSRTPRSECAMTTCGRTGTATTTPPLEAFTSTKELIR